MPDNDGEVIFRFRLPTAVGQHLDVFRDLEETLLVIVRTKTPPPGPGEGGQRLRVAVLKK